MCFLNFNGQAIFYPVSRNFHNLSCAFMIFQNYVYLQKKIYNRWFQYFFFSRITSSPYICLTTLVSYVGRKSNARASKHNKPLDRHWNIYLKKNNHRYYGDSIAYYGNRTKSGVENVDTMFATYSRERKSNRWPMAV